MATDLNRSNNLIAAARRRRVYDYALQHGAVNVTMLAEALGVAPATIRRDLNALDKEGKLVRSHGGAVVKDAVTRPDYALTRDTNMIE